MAKAVTTEPVTLGKWTTRPLRNLSIEIVPFWEGLIQHEFRLCRCKRCGACYFPYPVCLHHADIPDFNEMEWQPASGRGKVFAHVVVHQVTDPDYADEVPFALAMVELDEGPLFATRIVRCLAETVSWGMRVKVRFEDIEAGHTLPLFEPE